MAMAAELKVDSTPIEGFGSEGPDRLLELNEKGLKSVTILTLGYRDAQGDRQKVRHTEEEFLIRIN